MQPSHCICHLSSKQLRPRSHSLFQGREWPGINTAHPRGYSEWLQPMQKEAAPKRSLPLQSCCRALAIVQPHCLSNHTENSSLFLTWLICSQTTKLSPSILWTQSAELTQGINKAHSQWRLGAAGLEHPFVQQQSLKRSLEWVKTLVKLHWWKGDRG